MLTDLCQLSQVVHLAVKQPLSAFNWSSMFGCSTERPVGQTRKLHVCSPQSMSQEWQRASAGEVGCDSLRCSLCKMWKSGQSRWWRVPWREVSGGKNIQLWLSYANPEHGNGASLKEDHVHWMISDSNANAFSNAFSFGHMKREVCCNRSKVK